MKDSIGLWVLKERNSKGWSRERLASEIMSLYGEGLTPKTIDRLERGYNVTVATLQFVVGALLEIPPDELDNLLLPSLKLLKKQSGKE